MKNIFAKRALNEDVTKLKERTIKIKRFFFPLLKQFVKLNNLFKRKRIIIENFPKLDKGEQFIFAAGHSFPNEIAVNISKLDRHIYTLIGTTDQVKNNPAMALLWWIGMIYVNKKDPVSRHDSFLRMKKVLQNGSSVMLFPEGVLDNEENILCNRPNPGGLYHLAIETGKKVVPIVSQTYNDSKTIRFIAGEPQDFSKMTKEEAIKWWQTQITFMRFDMMSKEPILERASLTGDIHEQYMESRRETYMEVHWTEDVWDEEIMPCKEKGYSTPKEVRASLDKVELTNNNIGILAPIIARRAEDIKYDFTKYMHENWDKPKKRVKRR